MEMYCKENIILPRNAVFVSINEMSYIHGGATYTITGTAKNLKGKAGFYMAQWYTLATGYSYTTAAAAATGAGIPVSVISGLGAGYCFFVGNEYRAAYNYFSTKSQSSSTRYKLTTISFLAAITGVTYGLY